MGGLVRTQYVHVCMYVCMYVCTCMHAYTRTYCVCVCVSVSVSVSLCVSVSVSVSVCVCVCVSPRRLRCGRGGLWGLQLAARRGGERATCQGGHLPRSQGLAPRRQISAHREPGGEGS